MCWNKLMGHTESLGQTVAIHHCNIMQFCWLINRRLLTLLNGQFMNKCCAKIWPKSNMVQRFVQGFARPYNYNKHQTLPWRPKVFTPPIPKPAVDCTTPLLRTPPAVSSWFTMFNDEPTLLGILDQYVSVGEVVLQPVVGLVCVPVYLK